MQLIGMLDSPFVRRTAISLASLNLQFEHCSLSVFKDYDRFAQLNPLVKAPTLVLESGKILLDSSLIIQYAETLSKLSLYPSDLEAFAQHQQIIGIAAIASEKTIQIVYEHEVRPTGKQHQPWLERISTQLKQAYLWLEELLSTASEVFYLHRLNHAAIAVAVVWNFTSKMTPGLMSPEQFPKLQELSLRVEQLEVFQQYPYDSSMSGNLNFNNGR